jgi:hypothetical protein
MHPAFMRLKDRKVPFSIKGQGVNLLQMTVRELTPPLQRRFEVAYISLSLPLNFLPIPGTISL